MSISVNEYKNYVGAWWRSRVRSHFVAVPSQNSEGHSRLFEVLPFSVLRRKQASRSRLGIFRPSLWGWIVIGILTTLIGVVSISDTYWSFKNQEILYTQEQNPVGRWLIEVDQGDVALFMTAKMIGTMLVISAVPLLYRFRKWWGMTVGVVLAALQSLLFCYLNSTEHLPLFVLLE